MNDDNKALWILVGALAAVVVMMVLRRRRRSGRRQTMNAMAPATAVVPPATSATCESSTCA